MLHTGSVAITCSLIRLLAELCALEIELTIHFFALILQAFCLDAVFLNIEQLNDSMTRNCIKIPSICCRTVDRRFRLAG